MFKQLKSHFYFLHSFNRQSTRKNMMKPIKHLAEPCIYFNLWMDLRTETPSCMPCVHVYIFLPSLFLSHFFVLCVMYLLEYTYSPCDLSNQNVNESSDFTSTQRLPLPFTLAD